MNLEPLPQFLDASHFLVDPTFSLEDAWALTLNLTKGFLNTSVDVNYSNAKINGISWRHVNMMRFAIQIFLDPSRGMIMEVHRRKGDYKLAHDLYLTLLKHLGNKSDVEKKFINPSPNESLCMSIMDDYEGQISQEDTLKGIKSSFDMCMSDFVDISQEGLVALVELVSQSPRYAALLASHFDVHDVIQKALMTDDPTHVCCGAFLLEYTWSELKHTESLLALIEKRCNEMAQKGIEWNFPHQKLESIKNRT